LVREQLLLFLKPVYYMPFPFRFILLFLPCLLFLPLLSAAADREITLYAVGDVMLGRHIAKVMASQGDDLPFREIAPVLRRADLVLGNLESVIAPVDAKPVFPEKPYSFHAAVGAATALKKANFRLLSLANNHAMDYGSGSLALTMRLLREQGIAVFGAGRTKAEARQPVVLTVKGVRFGFLGYGVAHSKNVYATKDRPGTAQLNMNDMRKDIAALRPQVDVLVLSLHWGMEYDSRPSELQRKEARQLIDWGVDVIVGHHPHVMQGVEIYKDRVIAYSLGNFIFDQKGKGTDRSCILACRFRGKTLASAELVPLDRSCRYFPRMAQDQARTAILEEISRISPTCDRTANLTVIGLRKEGKK
jgi:poly-gamma-glutamate synthesis protein (capsule biosynthesis protein)